MSPSISEHYQQREPSAIRKAQILFNSRKDKKNIEVINLAIGNISLPMHPIMIERMNSLDKGNSPFHNGVVKYTSSVGTQECQSAFIHSIDAELKNKISNIEKIKPQIISTGNIGCITQIAKATKIPILHTVEIIDWYTGGPKPKILKNL